MKPYRRPQRRPAKQQPKELKPIGCTVTKDGIVYHYAESDIKPPKKKSGFSLVELMFVVAIVGILSAIAIPNLAKRMEYIRKLAIIKNTETVNIAVHDYMLSEGATETTFGMMPSFNKWDEVESLIAGGFQGVWVTGYIFELEALRGCYISQIAFKGLTPEELYTEL